MGQGTPLGNLVADAVIRRLEADSRGQDQERSGRPSEGHAPMDVDNDPRNGRGSHAGLEGVGARPPQRPPPSPGGGAF
eukprot:9393359-Pyramimonas_sp.AAC.1